MVLISSTSREPIIDHLKSLGIKKTWLKNLGLLPISFTTRSSNPILKRRKRLFDEKIQSQKRTITRELPLELLLLILHKLGSIRDCICFGAVCMSWQQVYLHNLPSKFPRQLPILMIPDHRKRNFNFLNPFTSRAKTTLFDSTVELPRDSYCIGSTEGWIAMESVKHNSLYLLNPFLSVNNRINLPTRLLANNGILPRTSWISPLKRIALSANPAATTDYVVAGILYTGRAVCFQPGAKYWTYFGNRGLQEDIIFYKDEFYMVDSNGYVTACNLSDYQTGPVLGSLRGVAHCTETREYLVEMHGELLLVFRELDGFRTIGCKIYMLDQAMFSWNKVKNLDGNSLFLGGISSMSVSASHFPSSKPNYVYFGPDKHALDPVVVNLLDGSVEKLGYEDCKNVPLWIEPRL